MEEFGFLSLRGCLFYEPYQFLYFERFRLLDTRNDGDISDEQRSINLRSLWKNSEFVDLLLVALRGENSIEFINS